jgi:hypothetical protein
MSGRVDEALVVKVTRGRIGGRDVGAVIAVGLVPRLSGSRVEGCSKLRRVVDDVLLRLDVVVVMGVRCRR